MGIELTDDRGDLLESRSGFGIEDSLVDTGHVGGDAVDAWLALDARNRWLD